MAVTTYTTVAGRIVHENRGGVQRFYGSDPLGSTSALYDTSGNKTDDYSYWPYGEIRSHTGSSQTPFTFVGTLGYYMDQAGQLYVRARYLATNLARWLTVDPYWPTERAYGYVDGKPTWITDQLGRSWDDLNWCKIACVGILSAVGIGLCGWVSSLCAVGTVVTVGGIAIPCALLIAVCGGAAASAAELVCEGVCDPSAPKPSPVPPAPPTGTTCPSFDPSCYVNCILQGKSSAVCERECANASHLSPSPLGGSDG